MYINPYILGPIAGAFFGYLMGCLMNSRSIIGTSSWIPTYVILGALAGLTGATKLGNVKDREKGEFLTETKAYKKERKKNRKKKDKAEK